MDIFIRMFIKLIPTFKRKEATFSFAPTVLRWRSFRWWPFFFAIYFLLVLSDGKKNQPNSAVSLDATNKPLQMDTFNKYEPAFSSRRWWDGVSSLWQIINLAEWKLIYEAVRLPTILFHRMAVLLVNRKDASRKHGHSKQTRLLLSIMTQI